jgi:clan AA aspartic protease
MNTVIEPKRGANLGRVVAEVLVLNVDDLRRGERGDAKALRSHTVAALVDSGATFFCLPADLIERLGLPFNRNRPTNTISGPMTLRIFGGARIEVQGRACDVEVMELPVGRQALLGQLPLEALDFWIDTAKQRLVGNPEHGGEWMAEVF